MHRIQRRPRFWRLFSSLAGQVTERLDRLDSERLHVNEEHAPAAAARVPAAARGGTANLGDARQSAPGAWWRRIRDCHVMKSIKGSGEK